MICLSYYHFAGVGRNMKLFELLRREKEEHQFNGFSWKWKLTSYEESILHSTTQDLRVKMGERTASSVSNHFHSPHLECEII